jgi:hypothetical protein
LNPGRRGGKPATNHLSYGAALFQGFLQGKKFEKGCSKTTTTSLNYYSLKTNNERLIESWFAFPLIVLQALYDGAALRLISLNRTSTRKGLSHAHMWEETGAASHWVSVCTVISETSEHNFVSYCASTQKFAGRI